MYGDRYESGQLGYKKNWAKCQWLTPIILTAWEAKIGTIEVQDQPGQKSLQDSRFTWEQKLGMVVHTCHLCKSTKLKIRELQSRPD
jgi:hypothetical protein